MREQQVEEARAGVVDRGDHGNEADQVEPAGEPAPAGAAQPRGPEVDPARRRERRGQLGHRERDAQDQQADHRPCDRDRDRAAVVECLTEAGEAAGQHRDDRERDREVGEAAPPPLELLRCSRARRGAVRRWILVSVELLMTLSPRFGSASPDAPKGLLFRPSVRGKITGVAQRVRQVRQMDKAGEGPLARPPFCGPGQSERGGQSPGSSPASTCSVAPGVLRHLARRARPRRRARPQCRIRRCWSLAARRAPPAGGRCG